MSRHCFFLISFLSLFCILTSFRGRLFLYVAADSLNKIYIFIPCDPMGLELLPFQSWGFRSYGHCDWFHLAQVPRSQVLFMGDVIVWTTSVVGHGAGLVQVASPVAKKDHVPWLMPSRIRKLRKNQHRNVHCQQTNKKQLLQKCDWTSHLEGKLMFCIPTSYNGRLGNFNQLYLSRKWKYEIKYLKLPTKASHN